MSFLTFLQSMREPIAAATGVPEEAITIYQQQDIGEAVNEALARQNVAILVALVSCRTASDNRINARVTASIEVEVVTRKVLTTPGQEFTSLEVAEWLIKALHGWYPADTNGMGNNRVLTLKGGPAMSVSGKTGGDEYIIANLQFEAHLVPTARETEAPADS